MMKKFLLLTVALPFVMAGQNKRNEKAVSVSGTLSPTITVSTDKFSGDTGSVAKTTTSNAEFAYLKDDFYRQISSFSKPELAGYSFTEFPAFEYDNCIYKYYGLKSDTDGKTHAIAISGFSKSKKKVGASMILLNRGSSETFGQNGSVIFSITYIFGQLSAGMDFTSQVLWNTSKPSTHEEILYLTKGIKAQQEAGLDLEKNGYKLETAYTRVMEGGTKSYIFRKLIRENDGSVASLGIECSVIGDEKKRFFLAVPLNDKEKTYNFFRHTINDELPISLRGSVQDAYKEFVSHEVDVNLNK